MPRYELVDGKSNKFWEIELEDESFTVRYGRIGTDGQEQTKDFDSRAEAKKAYQKLIDEKTKKGYVLVGGGAGVVAKSNPELEAAIEKDPNDLQAYLVYGDWLQANGDPRGELVAIQARLAQLPRPKSESAEATGRQRRRGPDGVPGNLEFPEAPTGKDAAALVEAAQKILADNREHFYGDLAELVEGDGGEEGIRIEWYCGFIRSLRLSLTYDQYEEQAADFGTLLAAVIKHPSARFLRHLSLGMFDYEGDNHYPSLVKALAKLPVPPTLRTLYLGDFTFPDENEISWVEVGNVSALYAKMPNLETLILQGGGIELGKTLELPKLSTLVLRTGGLPKAALKSIASSSLPELETLVVWTGAKNYGATSTVADVRPILEGKNLPKLQHLTIADSEYADEIAQEIASAPILPRLRTLDLSMGLLSDAGAAALAAHPEAFAHLDELVLDESYLTDTGIQAVSTLGKSRSTAEQRTPYVYNGEEHRYVSVGE